MLFSGKNIIVTGATGDLGVAIVQRLISQGAKVLAVAGHQSEISRLARVSGPGRLETRAADVSDAEQVLGYATRAFALWGQIDGFVNNAGIQTPVRPIVDFPEEDFDRVYGHQHPGCVPRHEIRITADARRRVGCQYVERFGPGGRRGNLRLCSLQTCHHRLD